MATMLKQPTGSDHFHGVKAAPSSGGSGDAMTQITSGPAALAQLMIYKIMQLYGEIMELQSEQRAAEVKAQVNSAKAQADETREAGEVYGKSIINAGIAAAVGGAVAFAAGVGYTKLATSGLFNKSNNLTLQHNELAQEVAPMRVADKQLRTESFGVTAGDRPAVLGQEPSNAVKTRMEQFKNGNFDHVGDGKDATSEEAFARLKNRGNAHERWLEKFNDKLNRLNRSESNILEQRSGKQQMGNQISSLFNSGKEALSSYFSGKGNADKAVHDAVTIGAQTNAQLQGANASALAQAQEQAFSQQNQEIQILEKIHQTNSVNG